ncbi:MAG: glycoside hydrolase family 2 TIM barrel-domain containing protein [Armatimonadota bacterium]|nr:glycoside hydrolase family 2 TIM barrel-domain containing protein [Armatimonadota bacterium]
MFYYSLFAGIILASLMSLSFSESSFAAVIPSEPKYVQSLDGIWRFKLEQGAVKNKGQKRKLNAKDPITTPATFEPFYELDYKEDKAWHDLVVPGNWEMAGFSPATYDQPDNASGFYRKWFEVPASWKGRLVFVNFDGVQNGAEIWLNGHPVNVSEPSWNRPNYHESGWTAWQADLTPHIRFGERNLLALRVTKNTKSADLDSGDYFFLGGIHRPVTLFSVPQVYIKDITVQTRLLEGGNAEVKVLIAIGGEQSDNAIACMHLSELKEKIESRVMGGKAELVQIVSNPKLWSAEHPNLYNLTIEIKDTNGKSIEKVVRRIGIREISIKDGVFLVNGVPVKLVGICRHDVYPSKGTAIDEEVWRKDLTLMKAANFNAIRTSHYPYGSKFYDLCDEMGFYVVDELPYCWCPTDDPEMTPAWLQRARETIARDKNHPCVVIWAIGNENKEGRNQKITADLVKQLDPTRPRLNSCRPADENNVEFDDHHYTRPEVIASHAANKERRAKWPLIYTENPNVWDVRNGADYGCLDLWAAVHKRTWEVIWNSEVIAGNFLWEWQDRAVSDKYPLKYYEYDPITGIHYVKTKGVVDGWRNIRPEYYHIKMVQTPVLLDSQADLETKPGFAVINVTNRYSFTDLSELKTTYHLLRKGKEIASGAIKPSLAPMTSGKIEIPLQKDADTLRVEFNHPGGWNVISYQFNIAKQEQPHLPTVNVKPPNELTFPKLNLIRNITGNNPYRWKVCKRYRGKLVNIVSTPAVPDIYSTPLSKIKSIDADIVLEHIPKTVVGHLHAEYENGLFSYRIEWKWQKADIQELGWTFEMPHEYNRFSWKRQALWSVYPETHIGRPSGTALPDSANVHLTNISRPDAFDFNSTKYNCDWASLTNSQGHGLKVEFAPDQRHHCKGGFGENGTYQLIVNKQCSPPRDISSNVVPDFYLELSKGNVIEGSFWVGAAKTTNK